MKAAAAPRDGAPRGNALAPLYDFVRGHLLIANNVVLASGTLFAVLDFLTPRLSVAPLIVYGATASLLALMVLAAAAPKLAARLMSAVGFRTGRSAGPMWRKPLWQFCAAILLGVSVFGLASVAKASQGGLMASSSPTIRSIQESMLGLRREVADIRTGVDAANAKLDAIAERSTDPHRDLQSLGYSYDDHGLTQAIQQSDTRAVGLFAKAGYKAQGRVPILNILNGEQPWPASAIALLPRSMFEIEASCDEAGLLSGEIKEPAADRLAAFKRLCPTSRAIESLRRHSDLDKSAPPAKREAARGREARARNLAALAS